MPLPDHNPIQSWAPSSGVLPGGTSTDDVVPLEGTGDSDNYQNDDEFEVEAVVGSSSLIWATKLPRIKVTEQLTC
ncbi:hypothetical protein CCACVL1_05918 [Corchorus capsularis]|uniref:Uncharacterized protein n=1 Tax=Corchorus capsularis TaxID=210143 RepID=A0A1R3JI87_COCAP|nr:hypothetical protein CCACVL1_05918 [Corchorus capsularis]